MITDEDDRPSRHTDYGASTEDFPTFTRYGSVEEAGLVGGGEIPVDL